MASLQVRNVPDDLHRALKVRAAEEDRSLSDLVLSELRRSLERPSRREVVARIARRKPVDVKGGAARLVRAERDAR